MRFGIVGPISKDTINRAPGETTSKFGAVAYSATVLAKLLESAEDDILCLSHVVATDREAVLALLDFPNIRLCGLDGPANRGTEIELQYLNQHERVSKQTQVMTPVSFAEMEQLTDRDYVILMPLNDTDIPLATVKRFRQSSEATIFLDIHGLLTGVDHSGKRYRKQWAKEAEWLQAIDILKMNEHEASWAAGRSLGTFPEHLDYAVRMVQSGLTACWITFGSQASLVVWKRQQRLFWAKVPVSDTGQVVDTIGCGDAASAGFIYAYSRLQSPIMAVVMGNLLGSVKASLYDAKGFPTRLEAQDMLYRHYRSYFHNLLDEVLSQQHVIVHEIKEGDRDENFMYSPNGSSYDHGSGHESHSHR